MCALCAEMVSCAVSPSMHTHRYAALPHCDLAALVARVDASLAAGDVGVGDLEAHPPAPPVAVRAWASYDACGGGGPEIEIVPATMRPRYQLTRTRTWLDSWRESYGGGGGGGGGGEERPALSFTRHFMVVRRRRRRRRRRRCRP